tara:strand:- start:854 stop:1648 length:795 start_codon:yes stop_codon:yes gene_type:complete
MSGTPYIRFFGDDWLSGTQDLDLIERGALITIVALTASTGQPPKEDYKRLSRRFGCTPMKAKRSVLALIELGKLHISDGAIINGRAIKEVGISQKLSEKQTENANARWSKNNGKGNESNDDDDAVAMPAHMPKGCQPEPEPEPIRKKEKRVTAPRISNDDLILILSNSVSADVAASFVQHRKDLKKPMTENMANAIVKKLEGHHAPDMVLTNSIANGWQGIFPEKITNGGYNGQRNHNGKANANTAADDRFDAARRDALRIAGL